MKLTPMLRCGRIAGLVALCAAPGIAGEIPRGLKGIVLGDEKREQVTVRLNGVEFEGFRTFQDAPFLLWPKEGADLAAFPRTQEGVADWLRQVAGALGHAGFQAVYDSSSAWRGDPVWTYRLERREVPLHEARVMVHWSGETLVGLVNQVPGPIVQFDDVGVQGPGPAVYHADRQPDHTYVATLGYVESRDLEDRIERRVVTRGGRHATSSWQKRLDLIEAGSFKEWAIPVGTFPDQISTDSNGKVWLSQPNNNLLTRFDPAGTGTFTQYTVAGNGPDGLLVGSGDVAWSGMYYSGSLGRFDIPTLTSTHYLAPYAGAAMAIPVETTRKEIWVTDHLANRISHFDPQTSTWIQSLVMPTANCWVVQGSEDVHNNVLYFTEYNADQLALVKISGGTILELAVPNGGGPAFCIYQRGFVYYSLWNRAVLGVLNVQTQQFTEYNFPVANEVGGPIWRRKDGKIAVGTRNVGYIMVFDPATQTFQACQIPTPFPGLKDGLTTDQDGLIWFTETGANKLAVLKV